MLPNLNYSRSKFTLFPRTNAGKTELVVLGGLSTFAEVYDYAETLSLDAK